VGKEPTAATTLTSIGFIRFHVVFPSLPSGFSGGLWPLCQLARDCAKLCRVAVPLMARRIATFENCLVQPICFMLLSL